MLLSWNHQRLNRSTHQAQRQRHPYCTFKNTLTVSSTHTGKSTENPQRPYTWTPQGKPRPAASPINHGSQQVVWLRNKWKESKWFMGIILALEWGLSLRLHWPYILSYTESIHTADHNFPSGCSLECVIRGANNKTGHSWHTMWAALN